MVLTMVTLQFPGSPIVWLEYHWCLDEQYHRLGRSVYQQRLTQMYDGVRNNILIELSCLGLAPYYNSAWYCCSSICCSTRIWLKPKPEFFCEDGNPVTCRLFLIIFSCRASRTRERDITSIKMVFHSTNNCGIWFFWKCYPFKYENCWLSLTVKSRNLFWAAFVEPPYPGHCSTGLPVSTKLLHNRLMILWLSAWRRSTTWLISTKN